MSTSLPARPVRSSAVPSRAARRWLLFMHQLPASASNLRVRTWRRLQQVGAIPIKQAAYALPDSATAREDFDWLKTEIKAAGGEATVFVAHDVDRWSEDALVEEFRRVRQASYFELAEEIERVLTKCDAVRRPRHRRRPSASRHADNFRAQLAALERIDFFGSAGRDRVASLLAVLDQRVTLGRAPSAESTGRGPIDRDAYKGRLWVTRPRPGVDRMSSAWLIRRFIDADARFSFAADRQTLPTADAIPFDMYGVEFSHQGEGCTFETLCAVFGITDPALSRIAQIVHDLDLKDGRFGAPDANTVGTLIEGLQLATDDDDLLLARGVTLFESLYRAFARSARAAGPRPLAKTRVRHAKAVTPARTAQRPARK